MRHTGVHHFDTSLEGLRNQRHRGLGVSHGEVWPRALPCRNTYALDQGGPKCPDHLLQRQHCSASGLAAAAMGPLKADSFFFLGYLVGRTRFFFKISIVHDLESVRKSQHRWAGKTSEALVVRFQPTRPHFFPAYKLHMNKFFICCILHVNLHFHLLKEAYPSKNNRFGRRRRGEKMYVL